MHVVSFPIGLSAKANFRNLIEAVELPPRILFFLTGVGTYVIFAYYTADLTARMTSGPGKSAVKSFNDAFEARHTSFTVIHHD